MILYTGSGDDHLEGGLGNDIIIQDGSGSQSYDGSSTDFSK